MKKIEKIQLPIDSHIQEIIDAVQKNSTVVIKASPGSGKTTRLPWALSEGLNKKVFVLEPRRLAAKLAAKRIADEENLTLGEEVGYHFRFEKMVTRDSKLIFYTEGTFLRKFIREPEFSDVDIVIIDEFHERHIETDLAFALLKDLQKKKPVKIVLMSATLDLNFFKVFNETKCIEIHTSSYPVEINYLDNVPSILNQTLELKVKKALDQSEGDALVFLPGMYEMLKVKNYLQSDYDIFLLHSELRENQDEMLKMTVRRKIILSTNIAESSITIPGIKVVIDSGIQREARYSSWNGLKFIQDVPVTKSSAIQRAGRAGRTAPGVCHRLYSIQDFNERSEHSIPEIEKTELLDICLLVSGTKLSPQWYQAPNFEKWKKSLELLERFGALEDGLLTEIGNKMLEYPMGSRLSRILVEGETLSPNLKEKLLNFVCEFQKNDTGGMLKKRMNYYLSIPGNDNSTWEKCLLSGFIDQLAKFRQKERDFIHCSGKILKAHTDLHDLKDGLYIILDITKRQEAIKVFQVEEEWLWNISPFPFKEEEEIELGEKISISRKNKIGSVVIEEVTLKLTWHELSNETKQKIVQLSESFKKRKIDEWKKTTQFERIYFWSSLNKIDIEKILENINIVKYFDEYKALDWSLFERFLFNELSNVLDLIDIDKNLPFKINLGGKKELLINYPVGMDPYIEAPIQDFFGIDETPSIFNGKIQLLLKLQGPNKRPIQITKDLKNFWRKTYQEFKRIYQRDYPKHYWPDNPWSAKPVLLKSQLTKTDIKQ